MSDSPTGSTLISDVADAVLSRREAREPTLALARGLIPTTLGSVDEGAAHEDAAFFASCRARLEAIDAGSLTPTMAAFLHALRGDLAHRANGAQFHHLDFFVTPYLGGDLHVEARAVFESHAVDRPEERQGFIALVHDYARLLKEIHTQTTMQALRGVRLAAPAVTLARTALHKLISDLPSAIIPSSARLSRIANPECDRFTTTLRQLIARELVPILQQTLAVLDEEYLARAPQGVGLSQYVGGAEYYDFLIHQRADSKETAQAIHELGLQEIERLGGIKARLRQELAPGMSESDFNQMVQTDPRWKARVPEDVETRFAGYIKRIEPLMPRWFARLPKAPWAVTRADPAVEAGMSFGYYRRPTPADPVGRYYYNGSDLEERSMIGAAHLIYHELLPGHHLQLGVQGELNPVHALQSHLNSVASTEGWAVYASELAHEMGVMEGFDLYGHCLIQSFIAARLVVDTGLNALGWPLERARIFMRQNTSESDTVIDHELLRYSSDIPAQALAYGIGGTQILALREQARTELGGEFDVREFHDAVLEVGGYPLPVVAERVSRLIATRGAKRRES